MIYIKINIEMKIIVYSMFLFIKCIKFKYKIYINKNKFIIIISIR